MLNKSLSIAVALTLTAGLAACDVDQTQEGQVDLPEYEKTQQGNLEAPQFDVNAPDVNVTTEEKTVEVPTVQMEEEKVDVPNVNVDTPEEKQGS
jgi:uncharacterized lipoprotein